MTAVIVPNIVRDSIDRLIDAMQEKNPQVEPFRDSLYQDFLAYYNDYGSLPAAEDVDFELQQQEG